jgi:hypothetical protein
VVTLPEISKVLSAHPNVRRAETAIVCHDGQNVAVAAAANVRQLAKILR